MLGYSADVVWRNKMNKINSKLTRLIVTSCCFFSHAIYADSLQITWADSSSNEDGFYVEKRGLDENDAEIVTTLTANTTSFTDSDVDVDQTYCYRIVAFNQAGSSYSDESCVEVTDSVEQDTRTADTYEDNSSDDDTSSDLEPIAENDENTIISMSHAIISKPTSIDVTEQAIYSFYDEQHFNESYSDATVSDFYFDISSGNSSSKSTNYFSFVDGQTTLSSGIAKMTFNSGNKAFFELQSNGTTQTARIYLQAGVWTHASAAIEVIAGDVTETVSLTQEYSWQYFTVDITFDGDLPITITTDSDHSGYSAVMIAGIVFEEVEEEVIEEEEVIQYASLMAVETDNGTDIDISDSKFLNNLLEEVNSTFSEATILSLSYSGTTKARTNKYTFTDQFAEEYKGYQTMGWSEDNGITMQLSSGDQQINTASIYFTAGAWTREEASIELIINGESELITLSSGYSWKNFKVDIEFEGLLDLEIRPVDEFSGYSALRYAGLTLY